MRIFDGLPSYEPGSVNPSDNTRTMTFSRGDYDGITIRRQVEDGELSGELAP